MASGGDLGRLRLVHRSIAEISRQVQESNRIAGEAVNQAEATDARINELSKAALRIGDVVNLITTIAEQTNLLALNATIEAARAGEAGRGFAVVAQEVKSLARQSAEATDRIAEQVAAIQAATGEAATAIAATSTTMTDANDFTTGVAFAVEQHANASHQVGAGAAAATNLATLAGDNLAALNKGVEETDQGAAQINRSAADVADRAHHLRATVEHFLRSIAGS